LGASSVLTVQQLSKGLERLFSDAADISLDIPTFHQFLAESESIFFFLLLFLFGEGQVHIFFV
jgi:hypothetical protein